MSEPRQGVLMDAEETSKPSWATSVVYGIVSVVLVIYLLNPGAGFIEFLPDNLPLVGQLDEVAATTGLIYCLSQLGIELPFLKRKK